VPGESPARPLDPGAILRRLVARGVDFVVIGGIAAVLHGSARNTFDLDICFATDRVNLDALGEVLVALHARPRGLAGDVPFTPDGDTLRKVEVLTLVSDAGDLDVLARPAGMKSYAELRRRADRFDLGDYAVLVAAIPDLLAMKRAAGRPKDLQDVDELEAILRLRRA
jgi:predicted nucleotidyltransferase